MYDSSNVFAKIIRNEIPCEKIYEDDKVLAFHDINPAAPIHILVIPKEKYISFNDFIQKANQQEVSNFFKVAQSIADKFNLSNSGYRMITNHGDDAIQTVKHFHLHLLGGKNLGPLLVSDSYHAKK